MNSGLSTDVITEMAVSLNRIPYMYLQIYSLQSVTMTKLGTERIIISFFLSGVMSDLIKTDLK